MSSKSQPSENEEKKAKNKRRGGGVRAARRQERMAAILECAFALLEEGGLDAITTPELAKRTGAALGALYRFFPSKNAVIAAMQMQALGELHDTLQQAVAGEPPHASEMSARMRALADLLALCDALLLEPVRHPARFRLVDELLSRPNAFFQEHEAEKIEEALAPLLQLATDLTRAFVSDSKNSISSEELERFPYVLWASLHGVTHFAKRDRLVPHALHSRRLAGSQIRLLLLGLGADAHELHRVHRWVAPQALEFETMTGGS